MQGSIDDVFISPYEAEYLIDAVKLIQIEQYGSKDWLNQHESLDRLNIQAHKNAIGSSDEYIMENFVTLDKINTLVADLLTTEAWKDFVFPKLLNTKVDLNQIKMYMGMYHESSVCNLLEVMLYHRTACESSEDGLVELIDYCYRKFVKMTGRANEIERAQNKKPEQKDAKKVINETHQETLQRQSDEIEFNCTMTSLSLIRFITDHINDLSVPIVHQLMENNDMPCVLVPLLELKPWLRLNVRGKMEKFEDQKWSEIPENERHKMTKTEAQIWLAIYNMFMSQEANRKYEITTFRKSNLLRLRKYINESLLDQLPMLGGMLRALEEMSMMGESAIGEKNSFIVQQMPELRTNITKGKDWNKIMKNQLDKFFKETKDGKPDEDLKSIMSLYGSDIFDQFDDDPKCAACGEPAAHRCSKCKIEWYCSRECQLARWKEHKKMCAIMCEIRKEDAENENEYKQRILAEQEKRKTKGGKKHKNHNKKLIQEVDKSKETNAQQKNQKEDDKSTQDKKVKREKIEPAKKPAPKIDEIIPKPEQEQKRKVLIEEVTETKAEVPVQKEEPKKKGLQIEEVAEMFEEVAEAKPPVPEQKEVPNKKLLIEEVEETNTETKAEVIQERKVEDERKVENVPAKNAPASADQNEKATTIEDDEQDVAFTDMEELD